MHTSTVTVAVLPDPEPGASAIPAHEIDWETKRGSGAGGQHRNKTESAVVARHIPTGIVAQCQSERSQHRNRALALALLTARVVAARSETGAAKLADQRRSQVGSGQRGDKIRTIRCQDGRVTDHRTGERWPLARYLAGDVPN